VAERSRGLAELRRWFLWPMGLALIWFVLCAYVITPALNSGNIDYVALYDQLGRSPENILINAIVRPQLIGHALLESLTHGNLVWGLLLPFLCLPLLRPRWILIATPILLQHLLSWRSSEWMIHLHYGAPVLPLFWIASVEAIAAFDRWGLPAFLPRLVPWLIVVACVIAQFWLGLLSGIVSRTVDGRIIPSSDRLLHDFLKRTAWSAESQDELTLLRNTGGAMTAFTSKESSSAEAPVFAVGTTQLLSIDTGNKAVSLPQPLEIH